ncbi:glycoside hydrolase family 97 protein [Mangrovibacterium lignilyticum]|uniref:glycoside hydrolase family 97 protein n=1 Tax=Mangrovibacterium lignilyticum TaxID=2668052 RepID=UPI0013D2161A|nr:glycoside hydrolase family 97 protein [Mangrovibacterium lignilyticum]
MIKRLLFTLVVALTFYTGVLGQVASVSSPNNTIKINVKLTDRIYYNLEVDEKGTMWYSPISMSTNQGELGQNPVLLNQSSNSVDQSIKTVWGTRSEVKDQYNELTLDFKNGYSLIFRAYDDGVAYRFKTSKKGELLVYNEEVEYRFWKNHNMLSKVADSFSTSFEQLYTRERLRDVSPQNLINLPTVIMADSIYLTVLESDLFDYPGMYLSKSINHAHRSYLDGKFATYPTKWQQNNFHLEVTDRADYIAKTEGSRLFPWRVIAVSRTDLEMADSDLVYKLARPSKINADWVKPGKVAWDWWNAMNLEGVDFETGVNNKTYEYYIDFAAKNNIEYVIMDEGWSDQFDVLLPTPMVDMEHLTQYAKEKGVKLILWAVWHTIDRQYKEAFELFEKWGIAGVKVDFIDRDDQLAIEFYERLIQEAAKHHLLVDFHGCSKPTGLHRTYPNLINYEGVHGNEYNKFNDEQTPSHNVDLPFTRMMTGPMDYTPGAMTNFVQNDFHLSYYNPGSNGTRCHQLGMFVVYFAPLQMLCDAPTAYEKYPDILEFLSAVPTTWDETKVLDGKLGEFIVIARKKDNIWYIGGMNDWTERDVTLDLSSLLGTGNYEATMLVDGVNANRNAEDYKAVKKDVSANKPLHLTMKKGGGFVVRIQTK